MEQHAIKAVNFESRGVPGRDAKDGVRGRDGRDSWSGRDGQDGEDGGHASAPTQAVDSKPNVVILEASADTVPESVPSYLGRAVVRIRGSHQTPSRRGPNEIKEVVTLDRASVRINSRGMRGGHGGRGGNGGSGGRGGRGRDATAHSNGGRGGDGGDGGDAGLGSSGADGGDAAPSQVKVRESQAYLLMLVEENSPGLLDGFVPGGDGGRAGAHGTPGRGGGGGRGGSSYSRTIRNSKGEVVRRIHRSGGFSGSSGSNGRFPNRRLLNGKDGKDSSFTIVWENDDGTQTTYRAGRYDLAITNVEIRSSAEHAIDTGLFERDQFLEAWVTVQNTNPKMPTPDPRKGNMKILVVLRSHRDDRNDDPRVESRAGIDVVGSGTLNGPPPHLDDDSEVYEESWIEIDRLIPPGGDHRLPVPFLFQGKTGIRYPVLGDIPYEQVVARPTSSLCGRPFNRALRPTGIELENVAELTPIEGRRVLAWGDKTLIRFRVENRCNIPLGRNAEPGRALSTDIVFGGSEYALGVEDFVYYNEDGVETNLLEQLHYEIETLAPGEARVITGSLQLRATERTRVPYQSLRLRATLYLGRVNQPLDPATNQLRQIEIQTVEPFPRPEQYIPHLVFVTNSTTERQEILNRRLIANDLKLLHADFNISYHGELDFDTNPYLSPLSDTAFEIINTSEIGLDGRVRAQRSADILKTDQALRAYRDKGIRTFFTGPKSIGTDLELRIAPQSAAVAATHNSYENLDDFFTAWKKGASDARENPRGQDHLVNLELVTWWNREVTEQDFVKSIDAIRKRLRRDDPHNRFILTYKFEPEALDPDRPWHQKIRNRRRVGSVAISRTTPTNTNPISHLEVPESRLRDPGFVFSFDYLFALMKSLPFAVKLGVLDTLDDEYLRQNVYIGNPEAGNKAHYNKYYLKAVYYAILSDLAEEQELLRREKWRDGLSRKELQASMPDLAALGAYDFRAMSEDTPKFEVFAKLAAEVDYMINGQREIIQGLLPGYNLLRRSHTLRKASGQLLKQFLENPELTGENEKAFRARFKERRSDRRRGLVELRERGVLEGDLSREQAAEVRRVMRSVKQRDGRARSYGRLVPGEIVEEYRSDRDVFGPNDPDAIRSQSESAEILAEQEAFDAEVGGFYRDLKARLRMYSMVKEEGEGSGEATDFEAINAQLDAAAEVDRSASEVDVVDVPDRVRE